MGKLQPEDKAGLYITVIFHLAVIIVLLASQIARQASGGRTYEFDFSQEVRELERLQQEKDRLEGEVAYRQAISERIDRALEDAGVPVRNIASSRDEPLKDDRGTDAGKLYEDAARLARELSDGLDIDEPDEDYVSLPSKHEETSKESKPYSGPSVLSWSLAGRKASSLPIPAYRCMGGGEVTVIIGVDNSGTVTYAKIKEDVSSDDACLRNFAIRAARMSRFSSSSTSPARQMGDIVYKFIPQR